MSWLVAALVVNRISPLSPAVNANSTAHECSSVPTGWLVGSAVLRPAATRKARWHPRKGRQSMNIEVMCRIADGPLRPGELEVTQPVAPLVSWSVSTRDQQQEGDQLDANVQIELHLPDSTVWTGEAYPVADIEPDDEAPGTPTSEQQFPLKVRLRGTGPLRENSIPLHADVVVQRLDALLLKPER